MSYTITHSFMYITVRDISTLTWLVEQWQVGAVASKTSQYLHPTTRPTNPVPAQLQDQRESRVSNRDSV